MARDLHPTPKVTDKVAMQKSRLMEHEDVVAYLGLMEATQTDLVGDEASNEDEDFS